MDTEQSTIFKQAFDAGVASATVREVDGLKHIIVPEGCNVHQLPDMRTRPSRKAGVIASRNIKDFVSLVNREKGPSSIILCDFKQGRLRTIVDFHSASGPEWCEYMVDLVLNTTPEWQAWSSHFGIQMPQVDFAEFMEERHVDVHRPSGAEVLEIALTLTSKTKVDFTSGVRLANGDVQLDYREESETKAGKSGDLEIPTKIELFLPIYEGFREQFVECLLRYRITNGKLSFLIKPLNCGTVMRKAMDGVVDVLREETGLVVVDGVYTPGARIC